MEEVSQSQQVGSGKNYVVVTDFDMSFSSMVGLFVKAAFAAIPAMLIVGFVVSAFWLLLALVTAALMH